MKFPNTELDPELAKLIEQARSIEITPKMRREQIISFAYGNLALHNPNVTKESIEKVYDELYGS